MLRPSPHHGTLRLPNDDGAPTLEFLLLVLYLSLPLQQSLLALPQSLHASRVRLISRRCRRRATLLGVGLDCRHPLCNERVLQHLLNRWSVRLLPGTHGAVKVILLVSLLSQHKGALQS